MPTTLPPLYTAQQSTNNIQLRRAQAKAYSLAKRKINMYWLATLGIAACTTAIAALLPDSWSAQSTTNLIGLVVAGIVERAIHARAERQIALAVSIQEEFDRGLFRLPWNPLLLRKRPTADNISALSAAYTGTRADEPWYPDTHSVKRPYDVVICQHSNLAWGAPRHRQWGAVLTSFWVVPLVLLGCLWWADVFDWADVKDLWLIPWLPLVWALFSEARGHFRATKDKQEALELVEEAWRMGLSTKLAAKKCQEIQDEITNIRLRNAVVPDWFDNWQRPKSEAKLIETAERMYRDALARGKA